MIAHASAPRAAAGAPIARLLSSAGWVAASHLTAQTFAYGSLLYLARIVAPAGFGTVAVGTTVVYAAALLVDHGTHGALVVRPRLTRDQLAWAAVRCLLISATLAVGMVAFARPVVHTFAGGGDAAAFAALAVCLPLYAAALVPTALLQRSMRFGRLAVLTATANVITAAAAVAAGLAGLGVWALVVRLAGLFAILAVLTVLCCRPALDEALATARPPAAPVACAGRWFFLFAVAFMLTTDLDNLVIGQRTDAELVGLYALAFTVGMAPCTQFAQQVGRVLFAAAAAAPHSGASQAEGSVALMSLLLTPLLPAGLVAAPVVLPVVLGAQWSAVVPVFQVLLITAVGMAIVNCLGEALAGAGHIAFRAKVMTARCAATLVALIVGVRVGGITGAALAQLAVFVPCAAVYWTAGARLLGTSATALCLRVRPAAATLTLQTAVTGAAALALRASGTSGALTATVAAAVGLAVAVPLALTSALRMRPS